MREHIATWLRRLACRIDGQVGWRWYQEPKAPRPAADFREEYRRQMRHLRERPGGIWKFEDPA